MGYLHIDNLYKNQDVLMFKELYAMEKIHGTSAHILFNGKIHFFSGGEKHDKFVSLFDSDELTKKFVELGAEKITIYGEAYGGKCQKMSETYGKELKFVAFDVKIGDYWSSVPQAEDIVKNFDLEFIHYNKITANMESIDRERDSNSIQAIRNGVGEGKEREGIILRPLTEISKNNGGRIISKHKNESFMETRTKREVSPEKLKILSDANEIAEEWVTEMRLTHVLDKLPHDINVESTGLIIRSMVEDIIRESKDEATIDRPAKKAISKRTALLFKQRVKLKLQEI